MKKERRGNRGRCGARPRKREEGSEKDRERRSERIAASECKSTASDQSTTRTTRNRKDSFFLLIFVKFPPPPATPPPARSALSLLCPRYNVLISSAFQQDIFLLVAFRLSKKGLLLRAVAVERRKILYSLRRAFPSQSLSITRDDLSISAGIKLRG